MSNAIIVKGANKRYGEFNALDDVDFVVPAGSLTALLGPRARASRRCCAPSPDSTNPTPAPSRSTAATSPTCRRSAAVSASCSSTTPRSSI
jgi:hypothetical protein